MSHDPAPEAHLHPTGAKDPSVIASSQKVWGFFSAALVLLALISTIVGIRGCVTERKVKEAAAQARAKATAQAAPPTVVKVGKQLTPYMFSDLPDGWVVITIKVYDFDWYPLGGRIMVYPPNNAKPFIHAPGMVVNTHYGPGTWKFHAVDPDATGVEVWQ